MSGECNDCGNMECLCVEMNECLDCHSPLIPCTCRPDCPGGMCSSMKCPWCLNSPLSRMSPSMIDALPSLRLLAANLATAAALCVAFSDGFSEGWGCSGEGFNAEYAPRMTRSSYLLMSETSDGEHEWRPGCGRPAQGWGK